MNPTETIHGPSVSTSIRVRYAETDKMGVVYYANYLVWFEVGRTEWLRALGWTYRQMEIEDGVALPVIEAQCHYRQPARYDDELSIQTRAQMLSGVRVAFHYEVRRNTDDAVIAVGQTIHAAVDRERRPCRLPERVRTLLA